MRTDDRLVFANNRKAVIATTTTLLSKCADTFSFSGRRSDKGAWQELAEE